MSSIFEYVNKKMLKNLGGKDWRPVKCLLDATKFRQLNILRKNSQSHFWEQPDDIPVEYSLLDILEPSSSVPETVVTERFLFSDTVVKKQKAGMDVNAGVEIRVSGEATQFHESDLKIQTVRIPYKNLESLQNRKLLDPEPSFLKHCRMRGDNLYTVTEVAELTNDAVLYDTSDVNALGKLSIPLITCVKGRGQGQCTQERKTTLAVPQGTVLAYKRKQLLIQENSCAILLVSDGAKQKTFQDGKSQKTAGSQLTLLALSMATDDLMELHCHSPPGKASAARAFSDLLLPFASYAEPWGLKGTSISLANTGIERCTCQSDWKLSSIPPIGRIEEPFWRDFKCLQEEVSQKMEALAQLSEDVQDFVFESILIRLRDRGALQDLMDKLELDSLSHSDDPGGIVLDELRQDSRPAWGDLILYLFQALMVLSDTQLDLLAQSVEKRILLQQLELVRSILEPNFKYPWSIPFTLRPELLAPLQGGGLAITYGLLEECGLKMDLNSPRSTWDLEAKMPLSALYGTLSLLQQLAEAQAFPGGQSGQGGLAPPQSMLSVLRRLWR